MVAGKEISSNAILNQSFKKENFLSFFKILDLKHLEGYIKDHIARRNLRRSACCAILNFRRALAELEHILGAS